MFLDGHNDSWLACFLDLGVADFDLLVNYGLLLLLNEFIERFGESLRFNLLSHLADGLDKALCLWLFLVLRLKDPQGLLQSVGKLEVANAHSG